MREWPVWALRWWYREGRRRRTPGGRQRGANGTPLVCARYGSRRTERSEGVPDWLSDSSSSGWGHRADWGRTAPLPCRCENARSVELVGRTDG